MNRKVVEASLVAVFFLGSAWALRAGDDKTEVKGMIDSRTGETLIVTRPEGKVTVVLTDGTVTHDRKGLFGLDKQQMSDVVLIPGLKVDIDGVTDEQGRVIAQTITVDGDDLETSEMIQAGLHPTAEQVAANVRSIEANRKATAGNAAQIASQGQQIQSSRQDISANKQQIQENMKDVEDHTKRFTALAEYDEKASTTVHFDIGSAKVSSQDEEGLKNLAQTAVGLTGYIIEVTGYADSSGSAAMNTQLSEDRAKAVITYLMQQAGIPIRHIVAPGAMGEYGATASNETKTGRAENRRVEVKVLVNRGVAGI